MNDNLPASARIAAIQMVKAEAALEAEVQNLIKDTEPLSDPDFWKLAKEVSDIIEEDRFEQPMDEAVWRAITGQSKEITFTDFIAFASAYRYKKEELTERLDTVHTARNDDGTDDLIDALPLMGEKAFEEAMEITSDEEFQEFEAKWSRAVHPLLGVAVFHGENYIEMKLEAALGKFLPYETGAYEEIEH